VWAGVLSLWGWRVTVTVRPPTRSMTQSAVLINVQVVLDDEHRVPGLDQTIETVEELLDVGEVEARGRLGEDVEVVPAAPQLAQLARQLDALRLAARENGGGVSDLEVAEAEREIVRSA